MLDVLMLVSTTCMLGSVWRGSG